MRAQNQNPLRVDLHRMIRGVSFGAAVAVAVGSAGLAPSGAQAQVSRDICGPSVIVQPGDTMGAIAAQCGVTLSSLRQANPGIDAYNLRIGQRVTIPGHAMSAPITADPVESARREPATYVVQSGDTLPNIAERLGTTVEALELSNPELREQRFLRLGQELTIPGTLAEPSWRRSADTFPPTRRDPVSTEPYAPQDVYDARRFGVGDAPQEGGARVQVTGTLSTEGVECPALRGDDGRLYTLAGGIGNFAPGDRVRVIGRSAEMSVCMQGTTINVASIEEVSGQEERAERQQQQQPQQQQQQQQRQPGWGGAIVPPGEVPGLRRPSSGTWTQPRYRLSGFITDDGDTCPTLRSQSGEIYSLEGDLGRFESGDAVYVEGRPAFDSRCRTGIPVQVSLIEAR